MKAIYINKYEEGNFAFYDLSFENNEDLLLRLSGVIFDKEHTMEDLESRAMEIAEMNIPDNEITEILIK